MFAKRTPKGYTLAKRKLKPKGRIGLQETMESKVISKYVGVTKRSINS